MVASIGVTRFISTVLLLTGLFRVYSTQPPPQLVFVGVRESFFIYTVYWFLMIFVFDTFL